MSPRYDAPARPGRRIFYIGAAVMACAGVGLLALLLWRERISLGTGGGHAPDASSAGGASPSRTDAPANPAGGREASTSPPPGRTGAAAGAPPLAAGAGLVPTQDTGAVTEVPARESRDARGSGAGSARDGAGSGAPAPGASSAPEARTAPPPPAPVAPPPAPAASPFAGVTSGSSHAPSIASGSTAGGEGAAPSAAAPTHPAGDTPGATGTADVPAADADGGTDRTPPVLDALSFDPPQIDDGMPARLMIHAHDDLAGIRSVTGNIRSPSGRAVFAFEAAPADGAGTLFTATVPIPLKAETGAWYVAYLYVPDRADNSLIASFTPATVPPGGTISVVSHASDSTPPTIRNVVLTNATVQGGERNHLRVDVDDDDSGVASVVGSFKSPSGAALIPFICRLNAESAAWEGEVQVPQNADCGQWTVNQILATDKAGNSAVLQSPSPTIDRIGFQVQSENCDDTAPTLDAFSLSPASVPNDAPVDIVISASVSDTGSGATSMTGWASGPPATNGIPPKILFACVPSVPSDPGSTWTGKIIVPQYAAKGTWRITRVRLQDRAQNVRDYAQTDPALVGATFQVQ